MPDLQDRLIAKVHDEKLVDYFYLRDSLDTLVNKLESLSFKKDSIKADIPFNASVKGYHGALDSNGDSWIIKPIPRENEALYHRISEMSYLLDFQMATLSAPTVVLTIEGKKYRGAKVVPRSIQISSYDYLKQPFKNVMIRDLVNRWLQFDEDRNPNNYMVTQNSKNYPLVVAIDFDKSDLETPTMKITGTDEKFGWIRHEKNRYLTLFKTEHFDNLPISLFDERLSAMMAMDLVGFRGIAARLLEGYCDDPDGKAELITSNIEMRRNYINSYFRTWFKEEDSHAAKREEDEYGGMGATFMKIYQGKK